MRKTRFKYGQLVRIKDSQTNSYYGFYNNCLGNVVNYVTTDNDADFRYEVKLQFSDRVISVFENYLEVAIDC